jgi:L-serine kinase (ADP)
VTTLPEFELVPLGKLRAHEEIDEDNVVELVGQLREAGVFADPIWVARGSFVILNGHHRVEALRRIGASRVPAWLLDYDTDMVTLEPWRPGLPITKAEVVRRGLGGHLFPPKTTRHRLRVELPERRTPLAELVPGPPAPVRQRAAGERSRPSRAGSRGPG